MSDLTELEAIPLTDDWNASIFIQLHGQDIRFCHEWGKWLIFDGTRWKVDVTGDVIRRAKKTIRQMYREAAAIEDEGLRRANMDHARRSASNAKIRAFIKLAQTEVPVRSAELNANSKLLNAQNGTVDLRMGKLREHRRGDYITKIAPVEWVGR